MIGLKTINTEVPALGESLLRYLPVRLWYHYTRPSRCTAINEGEEVSRAFVSLKIYCVFVAEVDSGQQKHVVGAPSQVFSWRQILSTTDHDQEAVRTSPHPAAETSLVNRWWTVTFPSCRCKAARSCLWAHETSRRWNQTWILEFAELSTKTRRERDTK